MSIDAAGRVIPAARVAAGVYLGFAGLQVALAGGAPLGEHVWGGSQDAVLSGRMRVASVGAATALVAMAAIVTARARPGASTERRWLGPATWAIAGYMALNTAGNVVSTSRVERFVFTPLTAVAGLATAAVARRS